MKRIKKKRRPSRFMSSGRGAAWNQHAQGEVKKLPVVRKALRASNEFWSVTMDWVRQDGVWRCVKSSVPIERFVGMNPDHVKVELLRLGCAWEWSERL